MQGSSAPTVKIMGQHNHPTPDDDSDGAPAPTKAGAAKNVGDTGIRIPRLDQAKVCMPKTPTLSLRRVFPFPTYLFGRSQR